MAGVLTAGALALGAATLGGCTPSTDGEWAGAQSDTVIDLGDVQSAQPLPDDDAPQSGLSADLTSDAMDLMPTHDLTYAGQVGWTASHVVDDHHIRVAFPIGSPDCNGAYANVMETPETITVDVYSGPLAGVDAACDSVLTWATMVAETRDPVGERGLVQTPPSGEGGVY